MLKRFSDIALSILAIVALLPVIFIIAILIWINIGRPICYLQLRPGYQGREFLMVKFRTMLNTIDQDGVLFRDEVRLTPFGKLLRGTSLDELPELWNVLKGDMSLVGPRPLLMEYLPLYSSEQRRRHDVKPGITGWAQVNGRNAISWEEKFKLDIWYVDNQSFWLDVKIIFLTVKKVLLRDGISAQGHVTIERFKGSLK